MTWKPKRMFKGKKSQAGIGENIGNVMRTFPKPLLTALFLIFLLLFTVMFSYILNTLGVQCSSDDDVYLLPAYNLFSNLNLITKKPELEEIRSGAISPDKVTSIPLSKCVVYNGTYFFNGDYCTDCNTTWFSTGFGESNRVCVGDVYPNPNKGWLKAFSCEDINFECDVPTGFFFNHTTAYLELIDKDAENVTNIATLWDNKLVELGGRLLYTSQEQGRGYRDGFRLSCTNLDPTLKFYGIPIFDFRLWLLLIFISVFFGVIYKLHNME